MLKQSQTTNADYEALTLRTSEGHKLEVVPEFGGITNQLVFATKHGPLNVLAGLPDRKSMQTDRAFRNIHLFPFANRLADGQYEIDGKSYQLPINEVARNNALHGFLYRLTPEATLLENDEKSEAGKKTMVLKYRYNGDLAGYPFAADIVLRFILSNDAALEILFEVHNRSQHTIPVGIGWHPYFCLGGMVDDWHLQLPQVQKVEINERMLPTGKRSDYYDFSQLKAIAKTQFDTCFALENTHVNKTARTLLWSEKQQLGLEIWQQTGDKGFNFLQLCIAQDRQSIAIEPVSCGIDAFNNGDGLIQLEPNDRFTSQMGVRLIHSVQK